MIVNTDSKYRLAQTEGKSEVKEKLPTLLHGAKGFARAKKISDERTIFSFPIDQIQTKMAELLLGHFRRARFER